MMFYLIPQTETQTYQQDFIMFGANKSRGIIISRAIDFGEVCFVDE